MDEPRRGYVAYLLRLWQVREQAGWGWRASLERAGTGERKGFADLDSLFAFFRDQAGLSQDPEQTRGDQASEPVS